MALAPVLVTPPSGNVVDLDELKLWLKIDAADDDGSIEKQLAGAIAAFDGVRSPMRRCLLTQTWRQDFEDWGAYGYLRLPFFGVSGVVVKYSDSDNVEQTVSADEYQLLEDECGSYVSFTDGFSEPAVYARSDAVRVTMTCGFGVAEDIPADIIMAIWRMVAFSNENRESQVRAIDFIPASYFDYHV